MSAIKLEVPAHAEAELHQMLVEHDVPEPEIARLGGAGGFLSNFLSNLGSGKYPLVTKLIQTLINKGIASLGSPTVPMS